MIEQNLNAFADAYENDNIYALDNRLMLNWYPQRILKKSSGESLLELGLGHGYTTQLLSKHFPRHVVIDGSAEIIQRFRHLYPDNPSEIVECYFENFTTDIRFDVVCMGFVLEHVADPNLILKRFRRFLKPRGKLFVSVPNATALNKQLGYEAGMLADMMALSEADLAFGHQRLFTRKSLERLVQDCGYKVISTEGIFLKPIATHQIKQLNMSEAILQAMLTVGIDYPELCVGLLLEAEA